jgi:hypothetical protein
VAAAEAAAVAAAEAAWSEAAREKYRTWLFEMVEEAFSRV